MPELTPEEREENYLEEKTRSNFSHFEAQESEPDNRGCFVVLPVIIVVAILALNHLDSPSSTPSSNTSSTSGFTGSTARSNENVTPNVSSTRSSSSSTKQNVRANTQPVVVVPPKDKEEEIGGGASEKLFGEKPVRIPIATQKRIYYEWTAGYSKLNKVLDRKYGTILNTPDDLMGQRTKEENRLEDRLHEHLMHKYHISFNHLTDISVRGVDQDWPIPNNTAEEDKRLIEIQRKLRKNR